jgi:hypothetical protein
LIACPPDAIHRRGFLTNVVPDDTVAVGGRS